jgi:MFS family permease
MPISIGGLALAPHHIGYILGAYGFVNALVQTFFLGRLVRKFGAKNVFVIAMTALIPIFVMPPLMNTCVRRYGWDDTWWRWIVIAMLGVQVGSGFILELGYGMTSLFDKFNYAEMVCLQVPYTCSSMRLHLINVRWVL